MSASSSDESNLPPSEPLAKGSGPVSLRVLRDQYDELAALAGSLAHEIKNPLAVIRMNMELLA